jgi:hypothetical protein
MIQNGRLSLRFARTGACRSAKECIDSLLHAYEKKIAKDAINMLEKCSLMGTGNTFATPFQSTKVEEAWSDFQQA